MRLNIEENIIINNRLELERFLDNLLERMPINTGLKAAVSKSDDLFILTIQAFAKRNFSLDICVTSKSPEDLLPLAMDECKLKLAHWHQNRFS